MQLENKVALVTGASRGIGWEIALGYAHEGADVVVCARNEASLKQLADQIQQCGQQAIPVRADVSQEVDVQQIIDRTLEVFGRIDVLCNNAGVNHRGNVDEIAVANWDEVISVNLRGTFLCSRAALPHMKRQNYGRIVDVSSGSSVMCKAGLAAYNTSKAAVNALNRTLANETAEYDILVNAMSPGFLKTDMNAAGTRPASAAVPTAVHLASLPTGGVSGRFFRFLEEVAIVPDVSDVDWRS